MRKHLFLLIGCSGKDHDAAKLWLRMQLAYDLEAAKCELADFLPGIEPASPPEDAASV